MRRWEINKAISLDKIKEVARKTNLGLRIFMFGLIFITVFFAEMYNVMIPDMVLPGKIFMVLTLLYLMRGMFSFNHIDTYEEFIGVRK